MKQATLAIVKPDATTKSILGKIIQEAENQDLKVVAARMVQLTRKEAEGFYYVHRQRPFFDSLTRFMSEAPVLVMVLRGEDAIARWRTIMGATDPAEAEEGTIRRTFAESKERNCVHGSDSPESAEFEIGYFFAGLDLIG